MKELGKRVSIRSTWNQTREENLHRDLHRGGDRTNDHYDELQELELLLSCESGCAEAKRSRENQKVSEWFETASRTFSIDLPRECAHESGRDRAESGRVED